MINYSNKRICAGIVLYNPNLKILRKNVSRIINQVDRVVLIDNNSSNIKEIIKEYNENEKIILKMNKKNLGIAEALNQIMCFASDNNYQWFLTMDQDSICDEHLVKSYFDTIDNLDNVAIISPFILNNNKISYTKYRSLEMPSIEYLFDPIQCITSASLVNTEIAKKIGGYNKNLFIDGVDVEFNIKALINRYKIIRVNTTYMMQSMGDGKEVKWIKFLYKLTKKEFLSHLSVTPVYGNLRLYYMSRNSLCIRKKYGKISGKRMSRIWMFGQFAYYFLTYPKDRSRISMLNSIKKGYKDYKKNYKKIMC